MDGGAEPEPHCPGLPSRTVAIIGGGFSGAAIAIQLAKLSLPGTRIMVFEPRETLGLGLAYSTQDPCHRLNARAARMSLLPDDPAHFTDWLAATGACAADPDAALPDGRLFPRREVFGRYVGSALAPLLRDGRLIHVQASVTDLTWRNRAWTILDETGQAHKADIAVLATGHPPPAVPPVLAPLAAHPGFIGEPLRPGPLAALPKTADILIIGTGLTMADCVAVLDRHGHTGRILAISRRGQHPRPHADAELPPYRAFGEPPASARALLRQVRAALAQAAAAGLPWQSVFDGLRGDAEAFWAKLPAAERRRLLRHARPFWDTHRHRLPPATGQILHRRLADGTLEIRAATLLGTAPAEAKISLRLRAGAGAAFAREVDAVVLTAGFGRIGASGNGLVRRLLAAGLVTLDETGQGLRCGADSLAQPAASQGPHGAPGPLFILGPPARGSFADIIGVPEIARQAAAIARHIAAAPPRNQFETPATPAGAYRTGSPA